MGYHTVYRDVYRESSKYASKGLDPAAGPGYFSPGKTCRSRTASVERERNPKEIQHREPEKETSLKISTENNMASPTHNRQKLLEEKKRKKMRLPFRN